MADDKTINDEYRHLKLDYEKLKQDYKTLSEEKKLPAEAIEAAEFDYWENNFVTGERKGVTNIFRILGYDKTNSPMKVENLFDIMHPEDIENTKKNLEEHFSGKSLNYHCEFRLKDINDNWIWYGNYGKVLERNSEGQVTRFVGLTFNINKRRIIEEEIRESERQYR